MHKALSRQTTRHSVKSFQVIKGFANFHIMFKPKRVLTFLMSGMIVCSILLLKYVDRISEVDVLRSGGFGFSLTACLCMINFRSTLVKVILKSKPQNSQKLVFSGIQLNVLHKIYF